jgi:chloramphenicol 3-O phosphotransferase
LACYANRRGSISQIIFLNGCGSSGKTSIARAIQHESPDLWLTFGVDTFIDMIPFGRQEAYLKFIPGQNERGPTMHVESGTEGRKLFHVMPQFAEMLAASGNNLIIDEVLLDEETLKSYVQHLRDHTVYYIGVFCDLKVMQEREVLRRDRCLGLSNNQINRVHQQALNLYDFTVDTTAISPFEAARVILSFIDENPAPKVFQS